MISPAVKLVAENLGKTRRTIEEFGVASKKNNWDFKVTKCFQNGTTYNYYTFNRGKKRVSILVYPAGFTLSDGWTKAEYKHEDIVNLKMLFAKWC